jgi:hypothetical protein
MRCKPYLAFTLFFFVPAHNTTCDLPAKEAEMPGKSSFANVISPYHFISEIPLPAGFKKVKAAAGSFTEWLQALPLRGSRTVYLFDGTPKENQRAQYAVIDFSIGSRDLQQCADAVMRLRAEYQFASNRSAEIRFKDNADKVYQFHQPYNRTNLWNYLQQVFAACGTASLERQLKKKHFEKMQAGDVLIRGGFPGHAAIVIAVAEDNDGNKAYLLAQSYMPAQDIHVLVNPHNNALSPWYLVAAAGAIKTPEYVFTKSELRTW